MTRDERAPTADAADAPDFRQWADDPANVEIADELYAHFLGARGVEMLAELVGCRGQQHQWTAERWVDALQEQFGRWWAQGRPRLPSTPRVAVSHWSGPQEEEARWLLASNLPPGATFNVARRWRKGNAGATQPLDWVCRIEDGAARAMAQGATPQIAARQTIDAWREFVTASRIDVIDAGEVTSRPPLLDAPSAHPDETGADAGQQAG